MENRNVILTGVPRSGTTLTCYLLNKLPDTVALNEPMRVGKRANLQDPGALCREIDHFFERTRKSLREHGTAVSRQLGGRVPDDHFGGRSGLARLLPKRLVDHWAFRRNARLGLRKMQGSKGIVTIEKTLSSDFLLCAKHTHAFTAILESLVTCFPCYATVRNPLSVLASWNSIDFNLQKGRMPVGERLDQDLARELAQVGDRFERQLIILSWFFKRCYSILSAENILKYEDIVASGGAALGVITPRALALDESLENKNRNKLYNRALMRVLGEKLLKTDGPYWEFYSRESVERLLED